MLRGDRHVLKRGVVGGLGLGRRDVADGFEQAAVVEPVDPLQRGELDGLQAAPRATPVYHLGLEQAVDRFGEGVVVGVADAADRGFDPGLGETFGVAQRKVLPGFNRSLQHQPEPIVAPSQTPLRASSSPGSSEAGR